MEDANYFSISHKNETFSFDKDLMHRLTTRPATIVINDFVAIYDYGSHQDILSAYQDPSKAKDFDGFFTLVFITKRGLKVVSDQFCSFPVYYLKGRSHLINPHI